MFRSHANFSHLGKLLVCYDNVAQLQLLIPPSTLATSCKELTHWKRLWCWEWLGAGVKGDNRGWDGWMASPTRWTWVWVNSGSWWWTGRPGVLRFMGSGRIWHDWAIELNWTVYSCHLFLISSAYVRSIQFLSCIVPIFAWNVPLVPLIFLKMSLFFPVLVFSSISLHWSLRKAFLPLFALLWNSAFKWEYLSSSPLLFASLLFTAICKAYSDSHFAFLDFFFLGMVLLTVSYNFMNLCP